MGSIALVVEEIGPNDKAGPAMHRVNRYLKKGVRLVIQVDPTAQVVCTYRLEGGYKFLEKGDELTGKDVPEGLRGPAACFFPEIVSPEVHSFDERPDKEIPRHEHPR
jgi:hypothetical protein